MNVQVFCSKCDRSCRVPPEHVGKRVRCPGCQEIFKAEQPPVADASSSDAIQVFCPRCDGAGRVTADLLGRRVRCANCQEAFKAEDVPVAALDDDAGPAVPQPAAVSASDSTKLASDPTVRNLPIPPPPPLPTPVAAAQPKPIVEQSQSAIADEKKKSPTPPDREDEMDARSSKRRDSKDDDPDRRRSSASRDEREEERRSSSRRDERDRHKDEGDSDRRKSSKSDDKKRAAKDDDKARPKKDAPLLEVGRLDNPFVDSTTLATSGEVDQSVFNFDFGDEPARDRSDKKKTSDSKHGKDRAGEKASADKAPSESAPPNATKLACFHLRQTGYWDEPRLFRVFVEKGELICIPAATGKAIPEMEEALLAESLQDFPKPVRNKVRDLNELSIDELLERDEEGFVWSANKIIAASIEPPGAKQSGSSRHAAVLQIEHKSKGEIAFDFPADADVDSALDLLRDFVADVLQVRVRWDKTSKRFVKR